MKLADRLAELCHIVDEINNRQLDYHKMVLGISGSIPGTVQLNKKMFMDIFGGSCRINKLPHGDGYTEYRTWHNGILFMCLEEDKNA